MKNSIENKLFEVTIGVRHKDAGSGKWDIKIIRVKTKLDALAKFAAFLKLAKNYPKNQGWEFDCEHAEVTQLHE